MKTPDELALEKGMPANVEAERILLGSILMDPSKFEAVAAAVGADDFILHKHRRIFSRMKDLYDGGNLIEPVALVDELSKHSQLEACDGITYVASLTDGMPLFDSIESYIRIVADKALLRRTIYTCQEVIQDCFDEAEPARYIVENAENSVMRLGEGALRSSGATPVSALMGSGLESYIDPKKRSGGLNTPFIRFDEMTTGLHPGELMILAARPSVGKSAMALNIAESVASEKSVAFFSLEMSKESVFDRLLCSMARVSLHRLRGGWLNSDDRRSLDRAWQQIKTLRLYIDDRASTTMMEIAAKCRKVKHDHELSLVVVDYLQLLSSPEKTKDRVREVGAFSRGLKLLAKDLNVPVIALSQLSRACETRPGDHRPILSDLRESGDVEQDADIVAFIFREEIYKPDREDLAGMAELIVAKQRNGPTGRVKLCYLDKFTRFENLAEDHQQSLPETQATEPTAEDPEQRTWYH